MPDDDFGAFLRAHNRSLERKLPPYRSYEDLLAAAEELARGKENPMGSEDFDDLLRKCILGFGGRKATRRN